MNEPKAFMLSVGIAVLILLFIKYSMEHEMDREKNYEKNSKNDDDSEDESNFEDFEPIEFVNTSNLQTKVQPQSLQSFQSPIQLPSSPVYHSSPRKSNMTRYIRH